MAQCQPNQSQHILLPINSLRSDFDSQNARGDNGSDQHTINALLVLATLIASVTFQAVVNPPGATTSTMTSYTLGCTDTPFLASCRCRTRVGHRNGYDSPDTGVRRVSSFFFFVSPTRADAAPTQLRRVQHASSEEKKEEYHRF